MYSIGIQWIVIVLNKLYVIIVLMNNCKLHMYFVPAVTVGSIATWARTRRGLSSS